MIHLKCPILGRKGCAGMASRTRTVWILTISARSSLRTVHKNRDFIYDRLRMMPDLSQWSVQKVFCWAMRTSLYNYVWFHIHGQPDVWADLFGRGSAPPSLRLFWKYHPSLFLRVKDFLAWRGSARSGPINEWTYRFKTGDTERRTLRLTQLMQYDNLPHQSSYTWE